MFSPREPYSASASAPVGDMTRRSYTPMPSSDVCEEDAPVGDMTRRCWRTYTPIPSHDVCDVDAPLTEPIGDYNAEESSQQAALEAMNQLYEEMDSVEELIMETTSVYGTAMVMPQFARSTNWSSKLTVLAVRSYLFLILNLGIQWMLLYSLIKEQNVTDLFSGQMYLCDFGAEKALCPDGPGCMGPGGTPFTPSRRYSFEVWIVHNFVKNSLKTTFPHLEDEINDKIDPGEYGVESESLRLICTWLFILFCVDDAQSIWMLIKLLWHVPTSNESWVKRDKETGEACLEVAGMPRYWKIINIFTIVIPKAVLWKFTADSGTLFLMETPGMQDLIVNVTALSFILNIDELLFSTITTERTRHLVGLLRPFMAWRPVTDNSWWRCCLNHIYALDDKFPTRLLLVTLIWLYFLSNYYFFHCRKSEDGTWYSKAMYLPLSSSYSHLSALYPSWFPVPSSAEPFWVMADEDADYHRP